MIKITPYFHYWSRYMGKPPLVVAFFDNAFGRRVWSDQAITDEMLALGQPALADGTWTADGSITAGSGSGGILAYGPRVRRFGAPRGSLSGNARDPLSGLSEEEISSLIMVLDDTDKEMRRIACVENLVGGPMIISLGYKNMESRDFLARFSGTAWRASFQNNECTLELRAV